MRIDTPQLATHLLDNPQSYLTPIGNFIRKSSFDELPQLISVLKGDMSIVGPRPALFNQNDLVELRTKFGIERLKPGITGWAQINGRDEIPIPVKVGLDKYYLDHKSIVLDLKIILFTALKVLRRDGIQH
jgi:O-antigen biosynthesis protein WbqP